INIGAPDVIITGMPVVKTSATGATFTFTISGGSADYQVDGGAFLVATSPIVLSGLAAGAHTLTIRSTFDHSHLQTFTWTVDATVGVDVIITSTPTVQSSSNSASIAFTISSGSAEYSLDGGGYSPATSPINLAGLSNA